MKKLYLSILVFLIFMFCSGLYCAEFYRTNSENYSVAGFDPIPVRIDGVTIIAEDTGRLPLGHFHSNNSSFMIRPEGNQNAGDKGAFVYVYEAEESGSYIIDISLSNVGTDVKGGDGGQTECYAQKKGDSTLDNLLFSFTVPISGDNSRVGDKKEIYLEKGDRIYLVFKANYDGFGDQFEGKLSITNRDAKPVFEKESQIVPLNDFRFYRTHSSDPRINRFAEMDQRAEGETFFAGEGYVPPILTFGNKKYEWTVRPEGDQLVSDRKGSVIGVWDCPEDGNFEISTKITNIGLDVFGGDGGSFRLYKTSPNSEYMSAVVYSFPIPISVQGEKPSESAQKIVKMKKGEKLLFQFIAGIDAYADQFLTEISINKTDKEGEVINDLGLDNYLAQMPETKKVSPIKIRKGIWLGMGLLDGEYRDRSADLWKKYLGDITVSPVCDDPCGLEYKDTDYMNFYNSRNIAVIPQTWGPSYQPYLIFNNGLEYLWNGEYLGQMQLDAEWTDGRISSHDLAMYSKASYNAFRKFGESAMANGGAGFGYCDFTFGWMTYSDQGFNPETLDYMRLCLMGKDKGFSVSMNGIKKKIKFKDYCEYYFGGMPQPSDLNFASWSEYMPVTEEEYKSAIDKGVFDQRFMLFDMLTSYLWLSFNNMLGETAVKNGGGFSSMPNPEWFRGSEDFLFGAGLDNVFGIWEEYFGSPGYLDGVYNHYPYFRKSTQSANIGVVMECGDGGNGSIYYSTPDAYLNAYELTASCQADYIELDFWPNFAGDYKDAVNNVQYRDRMRNLLSYGMGFNSAKKDKAKRLMGDFSVVSSRRHIRIFNPEWQPWSWCLDTNAFTPEKGLSGQGYVFDGLSQEGMEYDTAKNVIWAADMPVKKNFDAFLDKVRKGKIKNGFLMAQACRKIIDHKMNVYDFGEKYPEMEIKDTEKSAEGIIEVFGKEAGKGSFGKVWDSFGETVAVCGGVPIVKRQKMGSSYLYIVLVSEYNGDLWKALLENIDIHNSWTSDNGAVARIYLGDKMKIVGVQSPVVRDPGVFNKEKLKPDYQYLKYRCDEDYSVKVKFKSGQRIKYVSFPLGQSDTVTADGEGYVELPLGGCHHQLFYCADEKNADSLLSVKTEAEKYTEAMSFEGDENFSL